MENAIVENKTEIKEETDQAFKYRLNFIYQNSLDQINYSSIKTPVGTVFIDYWGSLQLAQQKTLCCFSYIRNRHLITLPHADRFDMAEKISCIAHSHDWFIAALSKTSSEHIMQDVLLTRLFIYDLTSEKKKILKIQEMPAEKIYTSDNDTITKLLSAGYQCKAKTATQEVLENEYAIIAVSQKGERVAIANTMNVYLAQQDQKGELQNFKLVKQVNQDGITIVGLQFNSQGNKLGIMYKKDDLGDSEIIDLIG